MWPRCGTDTENSKSPRSAAGGELAFLILNKVNPRERAMEIDGLQEVKHLA